MMAPASTFLAVLVLVLAGVADACYIQGYDGGYCVSYELFSANAKFCGPVLQDSLRDYRPCVPATDTNWPQHNLAAKDRWIEANFNRIIESRKRREWNFLEGIPDLYTFQNEEYGLDIRIYNEDEAEEEAWGIPNDCEKAFKNYFCWINFPRCDDEDNSLMMCRSACENLFRSCGYDSSMSRCGSSQFFGAEMAQEGGLNPETGAYDVFTRAIFPGQPFRDNEFIEDTGSLLDDGEPAPVCTPSIKNAAGRGHAAAGAAAVLCALAVAIKLAFAMEW